MKDQRIYDELRSNDIVMENFQDMMMSQDGKDRIKYVEIVTEAFANPTKQANLLNKLFKEIQKVEAIDFGKIPDSKGDITKYVYYNQMYQCIEVLNDLVEDHPTPNITSMNKLHNILLQAKPDFTFGYRTENFVIMTTYNLMVTSLYEMINICAVDATEYLRSKLSMQVTTPSAKQMRWIAKTTSQFIKMYESGQWNTLMKTFKTKGDIVATEANNSIEFGARVNIGQSISKFPENVKNAASGIGSTAKRVWDGIPMVGKVIGAVIALFIIIRAAIYYFINAAGKLSDRLKNITSILRSNASAESSPTALEKQKKMLNQLENLSDTIDYKIVKSEKAAEVEMKASNKTEFNPNEVNNISGSDFEI